MRLRLFVLIAVAAACAPPPQRKPMEMQSIGTVKNVPRTPADEPSSGGDSGVTTPNSGTPQPGSRDERCTGGDFEDLLKVLEPCEVPMPKTSEMPNLKDKLEIRVNATTLSTTPGGRVDLTITFRNKSNDSLPLFFTLDPMARIDFETLDAKGRRADQPTGKPPKTPAPANTKVAKITLVSTGTARIKIPWDAVKQRWAQEKGAASSFTGRGPPHAPAGPLPNGKYVIRILLPLLPEIEPPKIPIEVSAS